MSTGKKKTIGIQMALEMAEEIEKRASNMSVSTSSYCKIILHQWLKSGKKLLLAE